MKRSELKKTATAEPVTNEPVTEESAANEPATAESATNEPAGKEPATKRSASKQVFRTAFLATLPVLAGYLVLGFGFGILMESVGFSLPITLFMSAFIYAGSMQYVAFGLMTGGASLLTMALTTLTVNARHLFYGISMLDAYRGTGLRKPYLVFALTDETYALVCTPNPKVPEERRADYYLLVSLLNHLYWIVGSLLGAVVGRLVYFSSQGIDFALTALFLSVFIDQWTATKRHAPALIGLGASLFCLLILGKERFLIPAMVLMAVLLFFVKEKPAPRNGEDAGDDGKEATE